jgi:hypothetical protein
VLAGSRNTDTAQDHGLSGVHEVGVLVSVVQSAAHGCVIGAGWVALAWSSSILLVLGAGAVVRTADSGALVVGDGSRRWVERRSAGLGTTVVITGAAGAAGAGGASELATGRDVACGAGAVDADAAGVTGAVDVGPLRGTGCARGAEVIEGAKGGTLPVRAGEPPTTCTTVVPTSPATTIVSAVSPTIRGPDRLTGTWTTSGPWPSQTLC